MKRKGWLAIGLMIAAMPTFGQQEAHTWSITPKAGATMSRVTGSPAFTINTVTAQSLGNLNEFQIANSDLPVTASSFSTDRQKNRFGFTIGAEAQYQFTKLFGLSFGAYYAMQGCEYDDFSIGVNNTTSGEKGSIDISNARLELDYIQVPVLANFYVYNGLALKAGLQFGYCVHQSAKADVDYNIPVQGLTVYGDETSDPDLHKFDLTLPVGISYEYKNIVADLRYNIGLTNLNSHYYDGGDKPTWRTSTFALTVGYKFNL